MNANIIKTQIFLRGHSRSQKVNFYLILDSFLFKNLILSLNTKFLYFIKFDLTFLNIKKKCDLKKAIK